MFRGINSVNLDPKGRMAIPVRYRQQLEEEAQGQVVATIDTDVRCLLLYPLHEWEVIERRIEALPSFNRNARRIQRLLLGHATEMELDSQGRILLPPLLREYAALDKKIILVGQGKKFEIWADELWHTSRESWLEEKFEGEEGLPNELQTLSL